MTPDKEIGVPSLPVYPAVPDNVNEIGVLDRSRAGPLLKVISAHIKARSLKGLTVPQKVKIQHRQAIKRAKKKTPYW